MFNKYPYTDFHELNLDWLLNIVKEHTDEIESLSEMLPKVPTNTGTYTLKCTVDSDGNKSYSWEV